MLFVAALICGIAALVFHSFKSSAVYQDAVAKAQADARVRQALGEPIEPAWYVTGTFQTEALSGRSNLRIPLHGAKANGILYVEAVRQSGDWNYWTLIVEVKSASTRINLLK